jgi:hypothetical protein
MCPQRFGCGRHMRAPPVLLLVLLHDSIRHMQRLANCRVQHVERDDLGKRGDPFCILRIRLVIHNRGADGHIVRSQRCTLRHRRRRATGVMGRATAGMTLPCVVGAHRAYDSIFR